MIRKFLFLVLVTFFFWGAGCASKQGIPFPKLHGAKASPEQYKELIAQLNLRDTKIAGYKTLFRSRIQPDGEGGFTIRHAVVARKPGSIRVETLPLQGAYALSIFVSLEGRVAVYDAEEDSLTRGDLGRKMVKRILGINAEERDLIALLAGSLPPSQLDLRELSPDEVFFDSRTGNYEIKKGKFSVYARLDSRTTVLRYFEARSAFSDNVTLQISYEGEIEAAGVSFPRKLTLTLPDEGLTVTMTRSALKVVTDIPDSMFVLAQ